MWYCLWARNVKNITKITIQIFLSNAVSIFILKNLSKKIENLLFFCCEQKGLGLGSEFSFENNAIKLLIKPQYFFFNILKKVFSRFSRYKQEFFFSSKFLKMSNFGKISQKNCYFGMFLRYNTHQKLKMTTFFIPKLQLYKHLIEWNIFRQAWKMLRVWCLVIFCGFREGLPFGRGVPVIKFSVARVR